MTEFFQRKLFADKAILKSYDAALNWVKEFTLPESGISTTSIQRVSYAEVTGYLIPTLLDCGEFKLARQYANYVQFVQRPNGSFCGTDGGEYVFDTGQVLKGLLRMAILFPVYESAARKAADYILSCMTEDGSIRSVYQGDVHHQVHIYILSALKDAAHILKSSVYLDAYERSKTFYKSSVDHLNKNDLTHFYAYALEGFLDIGEKDFVMDHIRALFKRQRFDGSITAYPDKFWVCSVGMAQLAIIAYKAGMPKEGDRALDYLMQKQNPSGGFFGSWGLGAKYFPKEEISWAVKFLLDAAQPIAPRSGR